MNGIFLTLNYSGLPFFVPSKIHFPRESKSSKNTKPPRCRPLCTTPLTPPKHRPPQFHTLRHILKQPNGTLKLFEHKKLRLNHDTLNDSHPHKQPNPPHHQIQHVPEMVFVCDYLTRLLEICSVAFDAYP